jgi:hypothetical protein
MGGSSVLILPPALGSHTPHIAAFEEPRIVLVANLVAFPIALVVPVPIRSAIVIAPGAIAITVIIAVIIVGIISLAGREGYPKRNDGYDLFHDAPVTH